MSGTNMKNFKWQWGQDTEDNNYYYGMWIGDLFYGMIHLTTSKKPWGSL